MRLTRCRIKKNVDQSGRAVYGVGLRPLACWDYGFEFRPAHGCLSLLSVVCCQAEVFAADRSLVQRSPTECGVSNLSVNKGPHRGGLGPIRTVEPRKKKIKVHKTCHHNI